MDPRGHLIADPHCQKEKLKNESRDVWKEQTREKRERGGRAGRVLLV
jgi:hypothetical protein